MLAQDSEKHGSAGCGEQEYVLEGGGHRNWQLVDQWMALKKHGKLLR